MKKALIIGGLLTLATSLPASADVIIQPTFVTPAPVYAVPQPYPVYRDHHHHYDWNYWHRRDHDRDHDRRDWDRR